MSGFYGYFKGGKAAASQPDLRDNRKNEQIQFKEKFSTSEENLEKSQPWYNRLNPMNLFSYVRKAFSQQSLQGSEEEDSDTTVCSKQVQNALIQIVKNDETCTTDANGIILFTSKEMVAKTKDFYRFPFRRKTSKLETGDFMTMKKIRAGLSKDQIYFSDDGGTKVIHAQFDIGFIPQAVDKVLEKTELLTTVEIVFQSDSIIRYSEEICKAVMEFSQKGRCKCKRTIILDVRDEEKFAILQEFIKNFDEDYGNGEHELTSEVQHVDAEHTIKLQCRASIVKTNILQEQDIQFHDNDVIKWRHICEKNMFKLKQTLEERKQCIVEKLDFSSIEVRSITQISSKNQMKKWRKEIAGFIATELTELLQLEILVYNVDQDILEEVFDDLVQFEKLKSSLSVFKDTKTRALVLCGLVNELENSDSIIHETVKRKREKQASCVFSEKMSMASYEILNNSPSITNQKMQFPELEVSYSKSREQLEIHGKHKSASRFRDILVEQLKNIYHTELNISPQQTRLLLHRQTQDFIQQKLKAHGLNSSIDIRRDLNPNSNTERLKVVVLTEPTKQSAEADAIQIIRSSVKKESFSTRDPRISQLVEPNQWVAIKNHLKQKYEGKINIEHDKKIHMINLICTSDIKDNVMTWLDQQKELKLDKKVLNLELDKFEYLNKWHRNQLKTLVKVCRVGISVKQPYVNTGQSKPMFLLEGPGEEVKKVISYINDDLFRDVVTKRLMLTEFSKLKFLANFDGSVFDYLAENNKCFIRIDVAGAESLIKWMSPCGRQYFVCKGKAYDADVFVRIKQQKTSEPSKKSEQPCERKFEELVIPFKKGAIEKDVFNTNIVNMLQRIGTKNHRVLAMPMVTKLLHDASVDELVQLILDGIQCYINRNENFAVEKVYFHELWQDSTFDTVVKVLSDYFDDRESSVIENEVDSEDEETMTPRMIFITGNRENVNKINIEQEIQDLMIRQRERSLSRCSSTESVFQKFESGSIESLTFHLRKTSSESDLALPNKSLAEKPLQSYESDGDESTDVHSNSEDASVAEVLYDISPVQKEKKPSFFRSKKTKKMKHAKSTPNLPPLNEEMHGASKGQSLRKSHDDRLFAGLFETALQEYSGSIGLIEIKLDNNYEATGTCFVVNGGYVMTAYHVFKDFIDHCRYMKFQQRKREWKEKCSVIFGYKNVQKKNELPKYHFDPYPKFTDPNELDVIVLKIDTNQSNLDMPQPVKLLRSVLPDSIKGITFLGHPRSQPLVVDAQCKIIDPNGPNLQKAKQYVKTNFKQHKDCFDGIEDDRYLMIHSREEPGNSGSPGFLIGHQGLNTPTVCCLFLSIFPEFVFNKKTGEPLCSFPEKYMIERAVKMNVIFEAIEKYNPQLCSEIFADDMDHTPMEEG